MSFWSPSTIGDACCFVQTTVCVTFFRLRPSGVDLSVSTGKNKNLARNGCFSTNIVGRVARTNDFEIMVSWDSGGMLIFAQ